MWPLGQTETTITDLLTKGGSAAIAAFVLTAWLLEWWHTDKAVKRMRAEHEERITNLRAHYEAQIQQIRTHYEEQLKYERAEADEKIKQERDERLAMRDLALRSVDLTKRTMATAKADRDLGAGGNDEPQHQ